MTTSAATAGDVAVRLRGLVKRYGATVAVDQIDLGVRSGRMVRL